MRSDQEKIELFRNSIGLFVVADYTGFTGMQTARGILTRVTDEGDITIQHRYNPEVKWGTNIDTIKNFSFTPVKE